MRLLFIFSSPSNKKPRTRFCLVLGGGLVLTVTNSLTLISAAGHTSSVFALGKAKDMTPVFEPAQKERKLFLPQANKKPLARFCLVLGGGLEPPTLRASIECSTN